MKDILSLLLLFIFFSTNAFNMANLRNDAYLECIMNSHERTIIINGTIVHCQCGKFATSAKFETVRVVGYCEEHSPHRVEEKPVKKEEVLKEFPKPPEPILKLESEK